MKALPSVTGPSVGSTTENTALAFSSANGNEINVTDLGASGSDTLTLSAANGTLTLGSTTGITFTSGTNGSDAFTVSGAVGNLNAALNGLIYQPDFSYTGGDTLTVLLRDPGDSLSASSSVALTINAVAAPEISAPRPPPSLRTARSPSRRPAATQSPWQTTAPAPAPIRRRCRSPTAS